MQRFFETATKVFTWTDAIVDKMSGDEMIAIFVPDLTGPDFRQRAVEAGMKLLRATGHVDARGPWLSIGVGVHSGATFMRIDRCRGRQLSVRRAGRDHEHRRTIGRGSRRGRTCDQRRDLAGRGRGAQGRAPFTHAQGDRAGRSRRTWRVSDWLGDLEPGNLGA